MTTYSKILNLVSGVARTIDLSNTSNVLGVANLELLGSTSGHLLQTASATTTSYTIVWPDSQGAASTFLQNDGSGNLSWSPISSSPAISNTFVAGQSFSANTSYVVRWGMNALSETTNRVYAADYDTSSYDEFWALGIAMSTSGVTAGQNIQVYSFGTYTLGSSDTPFNTVNIGAPVWLTSAGAFSVTAPTGTSEADLKIGIIMSTTSIWLDGQVTGIGNANGGVPIYPLEVAAGGTGLNSLTPYAVICGGTGSTTAMQQVSGLGTSGYVLTSNGASALPTWQPGGTSLTFSDSLVNNSGTVTLVNDSASPGNSKYYGTNSGGTLGYYSIPASGITQLTGDVTAGPGTGSQVASLVATSNSTLTTLSALSLPTSQLSGDISLTSQVSGVLPIANGGTNANSASGAFTNLSPQTTKGDLISYDSAPNRHGVPDDYGSIIADSSQTDGWRNTTYTQTQGKPGKNYIQYADIENNSTTGWTLGTIGTLTNGLPTGSPTFGSGASGNLSIAATSSSIEGVYSLNYVSSAATTQGNMVASSSYAIDAEDQAKVLTVKFYYKAASGASNCNFSGTSSNSFAWALYDVTNSSWLSSAGNFNLIQNSGCGYVTGTCQTNATTANIRLCVYNANATSGATTITLDGFYVGPQTAPSGPAMGDWIDISSVITITGFGSTTNLSCWRRRVGDSYQYRGTFKAGTVAAAPGIIQLPSTETIDTTKFSSTANVQRVGFCQDITSSGTATNSYAGNPSDLFYDGSTSNQVFLGQQTQSSAYTKRNVNVWADNNDAFTFEFTVPIAGFSSNSVMSSDTDTRVVAFQATHSANVSFSTGNPIVLPVVTYDTHAGYNASTGLYTVQVTGYYNASVSGVAPNGSEYFALYKNTSNYGPYFEVDSSGDPRSGSIDVFCNAGDTLSFRPVSGPSTALAFSAGQLQTIFSISRKSGPAVITATEVTGARYHASSTSISGSLAAITYSTKDFDTHAGYSGSTYTIPSSGAYQINASAQVSGTFALNTQTIIQIYRNGSAISGDQNYAGGVETDVFVNVSDIYPCVAGDTIQVYLSSGASSAAIVSSNIYNVFSISKTGRGA